ARCELGDAGPDPCLVVVEQEAGAIFPTWTVTSDLFVKGVGGTGFSPEAPQYGAVDGGDDAAIEERHTGLALRRTHAHGGPIDLAAAWSACAALGPGWRVPPPGEVATTQHREPPGPGIPPRTIWVPAEFDQTALGYVWTNTAEPFATTDPMQVLVEDETTCAF